MYCPRCTASIDTSEPDCLCETCGWFGDRSETLADSMPDVFNPARAAATTLELYRDICRKELIAEQLYDAGDATEDDLRKIGVSRKNTIAAMIEMFCKLRARYETCPIETLKAGTNGLVSWPEEWTRYHHNACNEPCDMLVGPCACGAWHTADEEWVKDELKLHRAVIDRTGEPE